MQIHLSLLVIILLLNLMPEKWADRKKFILPFSFLMVLVYWAIRYDYGLDYWNYYNMFYSGRQVERTGTFGERWFYIFTHLFKFYYQTIIAESIIIAVSLFHLVRKYISPKVYWLFFLLLFIVTGFHFNLISAQRTAMAAVIVYWAFDLFYITHKRWMPFILMILAATMFHTSAIVFIIFPGLYLFLRNVSGHSLFIALVIAAVLSHTITNVLFSNVINNIDIFNDYNVYADRNYNRGWSFILGSLLTIVPWYYLCLRYRKDNQQYDTIFIIAYIYQFLTFIGLNFQDRYTAYLYPFFIIVLSQEVVTSDKRKKMIMLLPLLFFLFYAMYWYYWMLLDKINSEWSSGNMYFYHTIFDAPSLP